MSFISRDGEFLQFELKPRWAGPLANVFDQCLWHARPAIEGKARGTRIAVLGSSMDMGWGA